MYPYFSGEGRSELLVEVDDDPQTHQDIFLVLNLKEEEHGGEESLDMSLEMVIGWQTVNQLQHKLTKLLHVHQR
jgi:hypothetical protein